MTRAICLVVVLVVGGQSARAAERVSVLVLPFEPATSDVGWVGKGVQQTVVAELSAVPTLSAVGKSQGLGSPDEAVSVGREAGAKFVVFGAVQGIEGQLRVTGAVMEVAGSRAAGVIQATGRSRDVFALQDQVAAQVKSALSVGGAAEEVQRDRTAATTSAVTVPHTQPSTRYATRVERDIARIDQGTDRLKALEDEIDRLKTRLRDLERDDDQPRMPVYGPRFYDDFYDPYPYFRHWYYSPVVYYFPVHGHKHGHAHHGHRHFGSGLKVHGSFRSGNVAGTFRLGGGGRRR
jgi:TolB-like protein